MSLFQKRILVVDDTVGIHEDFRKVLTLKKYDLIFDQAKSILFANTENVTDKKAELPSYQIDSAYQGQEALDLVKKALASGQPYALAFVDIRMPPGWNGIETIKQIWKIDSEIQIVICTAHSDYSWENISAELGDSDNFLILKKPFDPIEIYQLAAALTKKWELKKRLLQQIETLEMTVLKRTAELSNAKKLAEQANNVKSEFLRNMSHELRTPLNSILGFAQIMSQEEINLLDIKEYSDSILSSANHLMQTLDDMFYMSTIESGQFESQMMPEQIDLLVLTNEVKEMHNASIRKKYLQFTLKIDSTLTNIIIDPTNLKRVLFHLISNAVKFTPDNGHIEIRAFPFDKDQFRMEIKDTGIGIHKEDINKLFTTFQQLDSSMSKKYQGIGIGLALVRHIIESQGGQVGVENNIGPGSTFFITLPMHPKN